MTTANAATDTYKAFRLSDDIEAQGFSGGSIAGPLGETINLLTLLEDTEHGNQDGVIVSDDPIIINALGSLPQFVDAKIPESFDPPVDAGAADVDDKSGKPDLVGAAEQRGLDTTGTKAELLERIQAHDRETQPGYIVTGAESVALAEATPGALRQDGTVTPGDAGDAAPEPETDPEPAETSTDNEGEGE
jgi:hypothetical protein